MRTVLNIAAGLFVLAAAACIVSAFGLAVQPAYDRTAGWGGLIVTWIAGAGGSLLAALLLVAIGIALEHLRQIEANTLTLAAAGTRTIGVQHTSPIPPPSAHDQMPPLPPIPRRGTRDDAF